MSTSLVDHLRNARNGDDEALNQVFAWLDQNADLKYYCRHLHCHGPAAAASEQTAHVRQHGLIKLWKQFHDDRAAIPLDQATLLQKAGRAIRDEQLDLARKRARYEARVRPHDGSRPPDRPSDQTSASRRLGRDELRTVFERALHSLPTDDRTVLKLREIEQRSFSEIAAQLAMNEEAVRKRHARAIQRFKTTLRAIGDFG